MSNIAPDFTLTDQNGTPHSLQDYRGRWLVVYFYAQDESFGCTQQACAFRDEYRIIQQFGNAEVIGINHGSVDSHRAFADKHHLRFPLLSDPDHSVTEAYGAWKKLSGSVFGKRFATARNTYIIDPTGQIIKQYLNVRRSAKHTEQLIDDLQQLQATMV